MKFTSSVRRPHRPRTRGSFLGGGAEQVGEQVTVVHHRLTQLFGVALALTVRLVQGMGGAIMLDHAGVLDRQVGDTLLEVIDRVTSRAHHFLH
jgi:hypothetical protein